MMRIIKTGIAAAAVLVLCLSAGQAFALSGDSDVNQSELHKSGTAAVKTAEAAKTQAAEDRAAQFCSNKRRVVGNILTRIANRGQKQIDVFTKIAERTEKFKEDKSLTVDNYDSLVTTVNDKKTAAETTVNKIKADAAAAATLSCDAGQPKSVVGGFKDDLKAENSALKAYKTAIKNLIVAVKSSKSQAGEQ
jgi:hypothetical protein